MVWPCTKNGIGTIAQDSIEVDTRAEESTRETEENLDGRNKEGHEREKPARRPVGRYEAMDSRRRTAWKNVLKPAYIYIYPLILSKKALLPTGYGTRHQYT
jgi:hypothetical protein